jgi:putative cell wall-binding protein
VIRRILCLYTLLASATVLVPSAASAIPAHVTRVFGGSRYATAASVAEQIYPSGANTAVLASGEGFPDALVAGPYAALIHAPLFFVSRDSTQGAQDALEQFGTKHVVIVGGEAAIGSLVFDEVKNVVSDTTRVSGNDRYETAAALASSFTAPADTVFVATGTNFPDALSAGAVAGAHGDPVLIVSPASVPDSTRAALQRLHPAHVTVLGGTAVVSDGVLAELQSITGVTPARIAGADRYATAVALSQQAFPGGAPKFVLATGLNFPDALSGGPLAANVGGPVLLVPGTCAPDSVRTEVDRLGATEELVLGGTFAVSDEAAAFAPCATGPTLPNERPRATVTATVAFSGSGTGYAANLNVHDASGNAVSLGVQSDSFDPASGGVRKVHADLVNHVDVGLGTGFHSIYGNVDTVSSLPPTWELRYYASAREAALLMNDQAVLIVPIELDGRLFFETQVTARTNGDSVDAAFSNVQIGGTTPNGMWNTHDFNFYGLQMVQTGGAVQGASFHGFGRVAGLPPGGDWDSNVVAGIAMIAEQ